MIGWLNIELFGKKIQTFITARLGGAVRQISMMVEGDDRKVWTSRTDESPSPASASADALSANSLVLHCWLTWASTTLRGGSALASATSVTKRAH